MKLQERHKLLIVKFFIIAGMVAVAVVLTWFGLPILNVHAQQPTGSIPTVTGTPAGAYITVYSDQNIIPVYAGPGSYNYEQIGILLAQEQVPALGYSVDGNWIQIVYMGVQGNKGWVYAPLVSISKLGSMPTIETPPTATPRTTPTIPPTLVAAYQVHATRIPTFTPPPPLQIPTFSTGGYTRTGVPMGFVIIGLVIIGLFGTIISFLRGR